MADYPINQRMGKVERIFYRLFRLFPRLEEASRRASVRIYDEDLDSWHPDLKAPITQRSSSFNQDDGDEYDGI